MGSTEGLGVVGPDVMSSSHPSLSRSISGASNVMWPPKLTTRFRLRTVFLAATLFAVMLGIARLQFIGRVQTEQGVILRSGPGPTVAFECTTSSAAKELAESFDRNRFIELATANALEELPEAAEAIQQVEIHVGHDKNIAIVKYDFAQWGRYHLELPSFRYVHDINDPIAVARNQVIYQSFVVAGKAMTTEDDTVVTHVAFPDGKLMRPYDDPTGRPDIR